MARPSITDPEELDHAPPADADNYWQESWAFAWHDPISRIGGWHHLGLARKRGVTDLWSCIWKAGAFEHRYQSLTLPPPDTPLTDFRMGPLAIRTADALMEHQIDVEDEEAGVSASLICRRTIDPVRFNYTAAKGHWEVYGGFEGEVRLGGQAHAVRGHSFIDRSWGRRDWADVLTYRLIWAMFGHDLAFKLYVMLTRGSAPQVFGFVIVNGRQMGVRHIEIDPVISSDGINPKSAAATVWAEDGSGYRLHGICEGSDIGLQQDGFMCGHANATFECGGRLGTGFIEAKQLHGPPPWDEDLKRMVPGAY